MHLWLLPFALVIKMPPTKLRAVIVPGNGDGDISDSNFYGWLAKKLRKHPAFDEVVLKNMPDPVRARRTIWLPFMTDELGADERTVLIGHSSGAVAAMRLLETHKLYGCVLVSACHTDLGDGNERASGYYPPSGGPWQWSNIRANAGSGGGNLAILHSDNDPFIPLEEAQHVAENLGVELRVEPRQSHFFGPCEAIFDTVLSVAAAEPAAAE